jgi:hypothetical protein
MLLHFCKYQKRVPRASATAAALGYTAWNNYGKRLTARTFHPTAAKVSPSTDLLEVTVGSSRRAWNPEYVVNSPGNSAAQRLVAAGNGVGRAPLLRVGLCFRDGVREGGEGFEVGADGE